MTVFCCIWTKHERLLRGNRIWVVERRTVTSRVVISFQISCSFEMPCFHLLLEYMEYTEGIRDKNCLSCPRLLSHRSWSSFSTSQTHSRYKYQQYFLSCNQEDYFYSICLQVREVLRKSVVTMATLELLVTCETKMTLMMTTLTENLSRNVFFFRRNINFWVTWR